MNKIALVDDNPDNLLLIQAILGKAYEFMTFDNSKDALAALPNHEFDLLILDISLPGMDGVTLLKELRKLEVFKCIPIMALTAHALLGDKEKYLKLGFDAYYSKPILNLEKFQSLVAKMIH
jgi:CheY-like chemotaxis protein